MQHLLTSLLDDVLQVVSQINGSVEEACYNVRRSPNLSYLDYFSWSTLNDHVYKIREHKLKPLPPKIIEEAAHISEHIHLNTRYDTPKCMCFYMIVGSEHSY